MSGRALAGFARSMGLHCAVSDDEIRFTDGPTVKRDASMADQRRTVWLIARMGSGALNRRVWVARQPSVDWGNPAEPVLLGETWHPHVRETSGGRRVDHEPTLYVRLFCTSVSDDFGHSGEHGECPHEILACVVGGEDDAEVVAALRSLSGVDPYDEAAMLKALQLIIDTEI